MTQDELNNLKKFFTADDSEFFELGNGIITENCTDKEIRQFLKELNSSQDKYVFRIKKGIGIYRFSKNGVV